MNDQVSTDVLIIGCGAAGLSLALRLSEFASVAVLAKGPVSEGSTYYAQGGVSAVLDKADSIESHIHDTLVAGAGLCDPEAVRFTVEHGRESIEWLSAQGVPFTKQTAADGSEEFHLTREGGHSHRRVVHADDATGRAIQLTLEEHARAAPNIHVYEHAVAVDLITARKLGLQRNRCLGAYVLNRQTGRVQVFRARFVILASGGASRVYLYSSNPDGSTGDGIAMAWRAGCRIANMEFMQFHPTCLFHPEAKSFLITEAVRGEGGHLLLPDGTRFMHNFDPRLELAPRDIVARAIDHEMKRLGAQCLYLDISHKPADFVRAHFPNVHAKCLEYGFDMTQEPLPIVPAAHYTCGGVMTDFMGRTDLEGLYAIGECAFTGLHGANRMASNSLLECLVFATAAGKDIAGHLRDVPPPPALPSWDESRVTDSDEEVVVTHNWQELRRFMWDYVGIVRTDKRLQRARNRVELLLREIDEYYGNFRISADLIELRNLAQVAELIIRCALARKESRGLHYTLDFPHADEARPPRDTVLVPSNFAQAAERPAWHQH
ncbi:L-aspartate oxidase [Plasticicumulans lactativorans]|uniref:L-aspartate oxidase n=1 Tax=Plasticicumulans lactativorans TaxID=1133106 RepID=A0A4R2L591_9GAMM|nr:L-aspartate oxidase [Plasticicumulans lactativorans]TCO80427.1 L-aspartate oxidase [Plasticicumulans lactativorans]